MSGPQIRDPVGDDSYFAYLGYETATPAGNTTPGPLFQPLGLQDWLGIARAITYGNTNWQLKRRGSGGQIEGDMGRGEPSSAVGPWDGD